MADPDHADDAWDALPRVGAQLSRKKTGIDLAGLQRKLSKKPSIQLATIRDFRDDVARLTVLTRQVLAQMDGELTAIPNPGGDVPVQRRAAALTHPLIAGRAGRADLYPGQSGQPALHPRGPSKPGICAHTRNVCLDLTCPCPPALSLLELRIETPALHPRTASWCTAKRPRPSPRRSAGGRRF
ncbi:hypothetical protein ACWC6I_10535 [Streptomyces sp. NPDC001414]